MSRVLNAFSTAEWRYWQQHYPEWMLFAMYPLIVKKLKDPEYRVDPAILWDGFHWHFACCLIQAKLWSELKRYVERMQETYLREHMQWIIHSESPRMYQELWGNDTSPKLGDCSGPVGVRQK